MSRSLLPSLRETYTDCQSLLDKDGAERRPLLEEYRTLYTAMLARLGEQEKVVLGVASPLAREGKTSVATNLAYAMATDLGKRVLLVNAVFPNGEAGSTEGERLHMGLAEYVADPENRQLDELAIQTPFPDLCVLFAGSPQERPSRLIRSERMRTAISGFREQFDITLVDMPPLLATSDALVLASLMDGVLLVVSQGLCSREALERTVHLVGTNQVVGIAFNRVQPSVPRWLRRFLGGGEWAAV